MANRRQFLGSLCGALAVVGFDAVSGTFVGTAAADACQRSLRRLPCIEGSISLDPSALAAFSTDAGNTAFETPLAILRPQCAEDIAAMVRFCRREGITISARGQGHTTDGQSLAKGGVMIEMSSLDAIHSIERGRADVDAGVTWRSLVQQSLSDALVPPVLTGYLGLSVGGTLSMAGISSTYGAGAQVDHVQSLEVVTGEGRIVRCSPKHEADLFNAVLSGLGQYGIITRAVVDLRPAPKVARLYQLIYVDNTTFFADMRALLARDELDDIFNIWVPGGPAGFLYVLNLVKFFDPGEEPDDSHLLRDLHDVRPQASTTDLPFAAYVSRVDAAIDQFRAAGQWDGVIHPWFDVFLPGKSVESYIGEVLPTLTPRDIGPTGFMLLFPQRRAQFTRPMLRLPDDPWIFLFDILTSNQQPGPDPAFATAMATRNRRLFDRARAVGGTRYPIGTLRFTPRDWRAHYGAHYGQVLLQKLRFDPSGILTPGIRLS